MRRRSGFTLVEVLVAMALILFIMTILAAAFGTATQTVSDLKAAGDLAERLRGAATVLKRDLEAQHCYDVVGNPLRLSTMWSTASNPNPPPPTWGFFRIYQSQPDFSEGADLDTLPSYCNPNPNTPNGLLLTTSLHYTITLGGNQRNDFLSAVVGNSPLLTDPTLNTNYPPDQRYQDSPGVYNSPSAEVAVFLVPTVDTTDSTNGGTRQLYGLYRRQLLTTPPLNPNGQPKPPLDWTPTPPTLPLPVDSYLEVSTIPTAGEVPPGSNLPLTFNSLTDLSMPVRRFWMNHTPAGAAGIYESGGGYATMGQSNANYQAADLLMPDVVSFDVRILLAGDSEFRDLFDPAVQAYAGGNPAFTQPTGPRVFDTWSNQADLLTGANYAGWNAPGGGGQPATIIPLYKNPAGTTISIKAIQIALRVWDFKTKKTRQVTIVQQM